MEWTVQKIINFPKGGLWQDGYAQFGFHDQEGNLYFLNYQEHWVAKWNGSEIEWSLGKTLFEQSLKHYTVDINSPSFITKLPDGDVLIVSGGNRKVFRFNEREGQADVFIDATKYGLKDIGNCEYDVQGNLWINEITGSKVWKFNSSGEPMGVFGDGENGFGWIYDLRRGPDGHIYVLDSTHFAVKMIDVDTGEIHLVAGTGKPGYGGDGGFALKATFGSNPEAHFDGPWSLAMDEMGNIYVGDTQNHVIRMVERETGRIYTVAGNHGDPIGRNDPEEKDPLKLKLNCICGLDYSAGCLFIPEWDGDLVVLQKKELNPSIT